MMIARDINFFAPYMKERETTISQRILSATVAVGIVGISGTLGYNLVQINNVNTQINSINSMLTETSFVEQHKEAELVILEKGLLKNYNSALMTVHDGVVDRAIVDTKIIDRINSTIPSGANLKSLAIQGGTITMNVVSMSDKDAADMKYNLDRLPIVKESFIPAINSDFGTPPEYTFSITCVLEEAYNEN